MDESQAPPKESPTDEDMDMWKFLIAKEGRSGPCKIWKEYKEQSGTHRNAQCLYNRFKYVLSPNLHSADLDMKTKVDLYKKYKIVVDKDYAEILKRDMGVEIDGQGFIIEDEVVVEAVRAPAKRKSKGGGGSRRKRVRKAPQEPVQQLPMNLESFFLSLKNMVIETAREATKVAMTEALKQKTIEIPVAVEKISTRTCLERLKILAEQQKSLKDIEERIDVAIQKCEPHQQLPVENLHDVVDLALRMVGY